MQEDFIQKNIIITESSRNLRALGRNALAGKWKNAILAVLLVNLIAVVPVAVFDALFGNNTAELLYSGYSSMDAETYNSLYSAMPSGSIISLIYTFVVEGPISLGSVLFFLANFRRHEVGPADVLLGFEKFWKAFGLFLYVTLFTVLWTFLFIVPGIIASMRYSQAFYILADDPDKGIRQCVEESKSMMKGNKSKYFCLLISFIGWMILGSLPQAVVNAIMDQISVNVGLSSVISTIASLFIIPVTAYMMSACSGFYEILSGHLIKETEPVSVEPISPQDVIEAQGDSAAR